MMLAGLVWYEPHIKRSFFAKKWLNPAVKWYFYSAHRALRLSISTTDESMSILQHTVPHIS